MEASRGIEDIISEITMDGFFVYGYKHGFIDVNEVINALEHGYNIDINEVDLDGKSLLMYACNKHDTEMIEILLNNNVDVNKVDRYGNTALTYACKKGRSSVVERLIGSGAKDREELIISCERGYYDVVEILLNKSFDDAFIQSYFSNLLCL